MKRAQFGPHDWLSLSVPPGPSWLLVDALEPETAYQFSVLAQNKLGTSAFSEVVTVNTLGEGTSRRTRGRRGGDGRIQKLTFTRLLSARDLAKCSVQSCHLISQEGSVVPVCKACPVPHQSTLARFLGRKRL